ncbi:MAG: zinc ribbon domain-containing protein [Deltaproteobacteria bacterium]|nr:zinc ribbon domain-containing protein [Deltaproteobacteria bacterium]
MPMYEYRCQSCNYQYECGGKVEKMISQTAFSLKGEGWFNSGYCPKTDAPKPAACSAGG